LANDTDGFQDMARVFIYLLREDQRVRFVLRHHPPEVREKIDTFREYVQCFTIQNEYFLSSILFEISNSNMGHTLTKWLRQYITSWKVMGSRPDEVN
jgi:hypothetical protein